MFVQEFRMKMYVMSEHLIIPNYIGGGGVCSGWNGNNARCAGCSVDAGQSQRW